MIDNLNGLARVFTHCMTHRASSNMWRSCAAESLVRADMGAAAVQRHMPEWYHGIVNEAKRWLRENDIALA